MLLQELTSLKSQLDAHLSDFELSESQAQEVTSQIEAMDDAILRSRAEIEVLEEEMRVANLHVFNLAPDDDAQRESSPEKTEACEHSSASVLCAEFIVHSSMLFLLL